jgi:hypothetical protein
MIKKVAVVILMCALVGTINAAETLPQFLLKTIKNNKKSIFISPEGSCSLQQKLGKSSRGFISWNYDYLESAHEYHPSNIFIKTETETARIKTIIKHKKGIVEYFYTITESDDLYCLQVKNS